MYKGKHVRKDNEKRPKLLKKACKVFWKTISFIGTAKTLFEIIQYIAKHF